jgi:formylglycine-generating enzyme
MRTLSKTLPRRSSWGLLASAFALLCGCQDLEQLAEVRVAQAAELRVPKLAPAKPSWVVRDGCRSDMARVDGFCVDRFEAHLVVVRDGVEQVHPFNRPVCDPKQTPGCSEPLALLQARSKPDVLPQAYVSQIQADAACRNAGKRLCTRREWRTACMGSKRTVFPYGNMMKASFCNIQRVHALGVYFGHDARNWTYAQFNDPRLNELPGSLVPTGSSLDCISDFGVYDAVGNVQEWVSDRVQTGPHRGNGIFVGAFYGNHGDEMGTGCSYEIAAHEPTYHDYSVGFRCCSALTK